MAGLVASARLRDGEPLGKRCESAVEVLNAERDVLERPPLARGWRVEQRQLAAACVRADEREPVRPVDHVHAEVLGGERRERIAVGKPVGDVVERQRLHDRERTRAAQSDASLATRT